MLQTAILNLALKPLGEIKGLDAWLFQRGKKPTDDYWGATLVRSRDYVIRMTYDYLQKIHTPRLRLIIDDDGHEVAAGDRDLAIIATAAATGATAMLADVVLDDRRANPQKPLSDAYAPLLLRPFEGLDSDPVSVERHLRRVIADRTPFVDEHGVYHSPAEAFRLSYDDTSATFMVAIENKAPRRLDQIFDAKFVERAYTSLKTLKGALYPDRFKPRNDSHSLMITKLEAVIWRTQLHNATIDFIANLPHSLQSFIDLVMRRFTFLASRDFTKGPFLGTLLAASLVPSDVLAAALPTIEGADALSNLLDDIRYNFFWVDIESGSAYPAATISAVREALLVAGREHNADRAIAAYACAAAKRASAPMGAIPPAVFETLAPATATSLARHRLIQRDPELVHTLDAYHHAYPDAPPLLDWQTRWISAVVNPNTWPRFHGQRFDPPPEEVAFIRSVSYESDGLAYPSDPQVLHEKLSILSGLLRHAAPTTLAESAAMRIAMRLFFRNVSTPADLLETIARRHDYSARVDAAFGISNMTRDVAFETLRPSLPPEQRRVSRTDWFLRFAQDLAAWPLGPAHR